MLTPNLDRKLARKQSCHPRLLIALAALFFLSLALLYLAREPLLILAGRALTVDDAKSPADYLVVLGGDAETRPFAAAALYRNGFAPRVLIFKHKSNRITDLGLAPTSSDLYRMILERQGVPPSAIVQLPGVVDSSWDEAQSLRRFLTSGPAQRIILVTSAEHTRRARWVFRKALAGMHVELRMAAARRLSFDETNWWKHDEGAVIYLHEYLKLPFYWLRYFFSDRPAHETSAVPLSLSLGGGGKADEKNYRTP